MLYAYTTITRMNDSLNPNQSLNEEKLEDDKKVATTANAEMNKPEPLSQENQEVVEPETPAEDNLAQEAESPNIEIAPEPAQEEHSELTEEERIQEEEDFLESALSKEQEESTEEEPTEKEEQPSKYAFKQTRGEIIERLNEISAGDSKLVDKQELDALKQNFYKLFKAEQNAARKAFIDEGGNVDEYKPEPDKLEEAFKDIMNAIKEKRSAIQEEQEQIRENNLQKKLQIIEKLQSMVENANIENSSYVDFRNLQQSWKEIKDIPQAKANELWKKYQLYVERFYDILKLNNEFREYDFKKNLEIKTKLCEAAEKLADESDIISAFHQLQKLHQEYREAGPVSRELREEIWTRFKTASAVINRKHQQHFETLKEAEQNNLDQKIVICEIVEAIDYSVLTNYQTWNDKTQEIIALQTKWKAIGFAPQKMNMKIFDRFRTACDAFFKKKGEFFKSMKESLGDNLEKKRALCEKAEQLKESTEWKETAEILSQLQKEWKTIGPVPKKHSEAIWKRFIGACDYFFEQKGKATSSQRSTEITNLKQKKSIIAKLQELNTEEVGEDKANEVQNLVGEWNSVGHVPFRDKDKIYKEFKKVVDELYAKLNISETARRINTFRSKINKEGDNNNVNRERERLVRMYDSMKNEIMTYENNIGFLSSSSKKGSSLVLEMQQKIEKLKEEAELVLEKIKIIDNGE